jgi:hypothetical protein
MEIPDDHAGNFIREIKYAASRVSMKERRLDPNRISGRVSGAFANRRINGGLPTTMKLRPHHARPCGRATLDTALLEVSMPSGRITRHSQNAKENATELRTDRRPSTRNLRNKFRVGVGEVNRPTFALEFLLCQEAEEKLVELGRLLHHQEVPCSRDLDVLGFGETRLDDFFGRERATCIDA